MGGLAGHVACQRASPLPAGPPASPALRPPCLSLSFSERDLVTGGEAVDVRADANGLRGSAPRPQVCEGVIVDPQSGAGCPCTSTGASSRPARPPGPVRVRGLYLGLGAWEAHPVQVGCDQVGRVQGGWAAPSESDG